MPRVSTSACKGDELVLLYGEFQILSEQHILVRFSEGGRDRARAREHVDYQRGNQGPSRVQLWVRFATSFAFLARSLRCRPSGRSLA
jgi:hypothetical protein